MHFYRTIFLLFFLIICKGGFAQEYISGTVYDVTKTNLIPGVKVVNTSGQFTFTDSLGRYFLQVNSNDSVTFIFRDKPSQRFAVKSILDPSQFDISLKINYKAKYTTLQKVTVYSKSYQQDSLENRNTYADIFDYKKPSIQTNMGSNGVPGMDINELINMFRFRRNKRIKAFQNRLEVQEQEKYVSYRFNKTTVKRITNLNDELLDSFLVKYRPTYEFTSSVDEVQFNQYILNASYNYKINLLRAKARKQEE